MSVDVWLKKHAKKCSGMTTEEIFSGLWVPIESLKGMVLVDRKQLEWEIKHGQEHSPEENLSHVLFCKKLLEKGSVEAQK